MKQALIVFFMIWFNSTYAQELPNCKIDKESGSVWLEFTQSTPSGAQKMVHLVGRENDWTNPYSARGLCQEILSEIIFESVEGTSEEKCLGLASVQYKMIGFKMTTRGSNLLTPQSPVIWFSPKGRFDGSKVDEAFIQVLNPNDVECSH